MQVQPVLSGPHQKVPSPAPKAAGEADFSYNSQDQVIMSPAPVQLKGIQPDGAAKNMKLMKPLTANDDGSYVYASDDPQFHGANALAAALTTFNLFQEAYGEPIRWSTHDPQLKVLADGGNVINAFYSRDDGGLFFYHSTDPITQQVIYGADSGEVTSHECGHAILDAIRPRYLNAWGTDPGGFHESFGDMMAMLTTLHDPRAVDLLARQTGGDLSRPNLLAEVGEQLGITINHTTGKNSTGGDYTRTALNHFTWQDPGSLPELAPADQLGSEPHSWSRLWTGAFYDVLTHLVQQNLAAQPEPKDVRQALSQAGDEGLRMVARLMKEAPKGGFTYRQMAGAFIQSDLNHNDGQHASMLGQVFAKRKILGDSKEIVQDQTPEIFRAVSVRLDDQRFGPFQGALVHSEVDARGSLVQDLSAATELKERMARLIQAGEIRYLEPGQQASMPDLIKPNGQAYQGFTDYQDGHMVIERNHLRD